MLDYQAPEQPTRVNVAKDRDLAERVRRTTRRLPDLGGHLPFLGKLSRLPGGAKGGHPLGLQGLNHGATLNPVVVAPPQILKRAARVQRQLRRARLLAESSHLLPWPGISALDIASGPRAVPGTPSGVRGALRDSWRPAPVKRYEQSVMPSSVNHALVASRMLDPAQDYGHVESTRPKFDPHAAMEYNQGLRFAVSGGSAPAAVGASVPTFTSLAPLAVVALVFFLVFHRS